MIVIIPLCVRHTKATLDVFHHGLCQTIEYVLALHGRPSPPWMIEARDLSAATLRTPSCAFTCSKLSHVKVFEACMLANLSPMRFELLPLLRGRDAEGSRHDRGFRIRSTVVNVNHVTIIHGLNHLSLDESSPEGNR